MYKLKTLVTILLLPLLGFQVQSQEFANKFNKIKELGGIEEYMYEPNGMNILLVQDNSAPVVTVQIVYRVGSKHEVPGNTGSTHLLEHLNFKGTPKFNKDKGTAIFSVLQGIGAQMNATTWNDRTNYYETIPSDQLELAIEIEADRMRNSLLLEDDKNAEMTVVRNEFERGENNPNSLLNKEIWATAYLAHPYHHPTIGWRSDIEKMPIQVLRDFYNTYYWPNNATLTIIGDFQKESVFGFIDTYFGKITKAPDEIPQPYTEEPQQYGSRKVVVKKTGQQGVLNIAYKIPGRLHEDLPALTVLGQILGSGTSSILNKTFVDSGKALYAYASPSNFKDVGLFSVGLGFKADGNHEEFNEQLLATLEDVKNNGVLQIDIDRIVAKLNAQSILSRDGSGSIASQLNEAIASGDWTDYIKGAERLSKVTAEDVKRVANTYLVEDQSTTGYFVPVMSGMNDPSENDRPSYYESSDSGKYYFRHPEHYCTETCLGRDTFKTNNNNQTIIPKIKTETTRVNEKEFKREKINGIDVISAKTGAKDFITVAASFPIGSYFNAKGNEMIPSLTTQMLSKGTTKQDKFAFSQKLEKLGVSLYVGAGGQEISISFKCLKKDLSEVVGLLAEQLRYPLFDEKEFEVLKNQIIGNMQNSLTSPGTMGSIALSQTLYPKGHPNYSTSIETSIENINNATLEELRDFHKTYFGPAGMHFVAVGDVDTKILNKALEDSFDNWYGGRIGKIEYDEPQKNDGKVQVVTIPDKPSAEMYIGQYTGIQRMDDDYLPFYIGTSILGGGFSGRLMQSVRDEQGLTYNISANHEGHIDAGGNWVVNASFNPDLFQKGLDATMEQIKKWVHDGITAEELAAKKSNLMGSYKVGLSTTRGLSNTILSFVERGLEPSYIYQYPKDVEAVTLEQINNSIKKHIDLDRLIIIKSGSLNQDGNPLN